VITKIKRSGLLATTAFCSAVVSTLALAPIAAQAQDAEKKEEAKDDAVTEVVVTGTRIRLRDTTGSSPIVTVTSEALEEIGTGTVETYLNSLPQLSPSLTKTNNNPTGGGAAFLDLRQLGTGRGLVLANGRRMVPGSSNGAVDVSLLPGNMIDRVEIITGGASAVYGADAISGVVNFILKDKFEGVQFTGQYGLSEEGDAAESNYGFIAGGAFDGGKGHIVVSGSYNKRDALGQAERDFSKEARYCDTTGCLLYGSTTTGEGTFSVTNNATLISGLKDYFTGLGMSTADANSLIGSGQRIGFNPDGSMFVAGNGARFASDGSAVWGYTGPNTSGYDSTYAYLYNYNPVNLLISPFERTNLYTTVRYDVTDNIEFYGDAWFSTYTSSNQLAESPASFTVTVATSPTLPSALQTIMTDAGITSFSLARRTLELGPRTYNFDTTAYQATGGFRGDFPVYNDKRWDFDVFASYGKYENRLAFEGFPDRNRILAALAGCPTGSPTGPVGSAGTVTNCVTLNPFGANNITQAQAEYITAKGQVEVTTIEQKNLVGSITGDLFTLPAGAVSFAVGAEYRDLSYSDVPPEAVQTGALLGGNSAGPVAGGYDVKETFAELRVPIIADKPFAHYFGLEAGARHSKYGLGFSADTWKYGGEYGPTDWIRFRALKQKAIRAPGLGDLYGTRAEGYPSVTAGNLDPCDKDPAQRAGTNAAQVLTLCQTQSNQINASWDSVGTQYRTFSGGNSNLQPETANTSTIGVVIKAPDFFPPVLSTLGMTIDYFDIKIEDVISSVGFSTSLSRCFSATYNPNFSNSNPYCQNISRDAATGYLTSTGQDGYILGTAANLAQMLASGVDFAVTYKITPSDYGLPEWTGKLGMTLQGTWYENQQIQSLPGDTFSDNYVGTIGDGTPGATALPEYKINTRFAWSYKDFSASLRWLYIDGMTDPAADGCDTCFGKVPAYNYFYLNGSWKVNDHLEIFGGIDNLTNKKPPIYESGFQYQTDPSTYDVIGRYFYVGAKARF